MPIRSAGCSGSRSPGSAIRRRRHPDPYPVIAALIEAGIIGDVRPPDLLRFGFNALYTSYRDVYTAVQALRQVIVSGRYREPRFAVRHTVT